MDKEKRGANFTKTEIDLLIDVILKYKHIVENKKTDATTWKDKNAAWEKISEEFNAVSGNFPRSTKRIRAKYDTVKKGIRQKCSFLKTEQTKTGGGQCPVTLTPSEEKILSLTPNTMVGLQSRFDKDNAEPGQSSLRQWMSQEDEGDELGATVTDENIIEVIDGKNDDLLEYLSTIGNSKIPQAASEKAEQSTNPNKKGSKRKISVADLDKDDTPTIGTDSKFIFKNKRLRKNAYQDQKLQGNLQLKKEILELQKEMIIQEIHAKSEINKLTIENLKITQRLLQQKLEANFVDDDNY
ncbi:fibrinogen silencer-binding protein-like isoform X1 [Athalia rosae]|uniref:fibrinogen silencer-binding protein-like isoform X1 n=2 Tax=Athalia rosae TaxID=37344 RepID=UPI0020333385|nr:fibrinogen silencer-binding protein-like isoform X1 [Athalia rosae]